MLQAAINAEVEGFIATHSDRRDEHGRRVVVRNGHLPSREIMTGAGPLEVQQPRVRDNSVEKENRVFFSPNVLPPYLKRTKAIEELIPWLYLKGVSTNDFQEALLGPDCPGLSATTVTRFKAVWAEPAEPITATIDGQFDNTGMNPGCKPRGTDGWDGASFRWNLAVFLLSLAGSRRPSWTE